MSQILIQTTVPVVSKLTGHVNEMLSSHMKETEDAGSTGPTTTVFVGNISEKASDMLVRQLLAVSECCIIRTLDIYSIFLQITERQQGFCVLRL